MYSEWEVQKVLVVTRDKSSGWKNLLFCLNHRKILFVAKVLAKSFFFSRRWSEWLEAEDGAVDISHKLSILTFGTKVPKKNQFESYCVKPVVCVFWILMFMALFHRR